MNYKGYAARLEYSEEDSLFAGHIGRFSLCSSKWSVPELVDR